MSNLAPSLENSKTRIDDGNFHHDIEMTRCAVVRPTLHYLPILYVNTKDDDRLYPGK